MRKLPSSAIAPLAALLVVVGVAAAVSSRQPAAADKEASATMTKSDTGVRNKRCASQRTYAAIQQELFRQAAETRGSDAAAFGQISNYSIVRMEQPIVRSFDKELGTVRCSGKLILQLPRGIAVVGGRQALAAEIDYVLQPAADGSGDVVMLEGEAPITVPLATLARSGSYPEMAVRREAALDPAPVATAPVTTQVAMRPTAPVRAEVAAPAAPPKRTAEALRPPASPPTTPARPRLAQADSRGAKVAATESQLQAAKPSFNCRYARTRGEVSVCRDGGLASLDRRVAADYYRAVASGNARQREALRSSRTSFLRKRDRCTSQACMSASYRERMDEIGRITTSE